MGTNTPPYFSYELVCNFPDVGDALEPCCVNYSACIFGTEYQLPDGIYDKTRVVIEYDW
jgi:hypothetical protein